MAFLAFLLAVGALILAFRNQAAVQELKRLQFLLQRENARLNDRLNKILAGQEPAPPAPPEPIQPPTPARTEAARRPEPILPPTPARAETPVRPEQAPILKVDKPAPPSPSLPAVLPPKPAFDWESLVGVKLFSWIAGIALVFAAIFFLRYSVEHGWLGPPIQMAIGLVTGISLLVVCEWKVARRYSVTVDALDGAGIAILFATFFAANSRWELLGVLPTFGMMALVTVVAVLLSLLHNSVFVALLGLVGGFATPALLSTGEDRPIGLFAYLLMLNAGLAWVAYHKRWPHLTVLSTVFTTLYQWGWAMRFLQPGALPLALTIFSVFPLLAQITLTLGEKGRDPDRHSSLFRHTSAISMALPLLFYVSIAAHPSYGSRYWVLFGFLFLLDAGLALIATKRGPEALHLAGGAGTVVSLLAWLLSSYSSAAWPGVLAVVSIFVALYLATACWSRFKDVGTYGVLAAPLLMIAFPVLAGIEPATSAPGALFAVLFVLAGAVATYSVRRLNPAVHLLAAVFVLATEVVWSANHLRAENLPSGLMIYAIFGVFYLGVPILQKEWKTESEVRSSDLKTRLSAFLALSGHALLLFVVLDSALSVRVWPFLITLGFLNLAIAFATLYTRTGGLLLVALVASQLLLAIGQGSAPDAWPAAGTVSAVLVAAIGAIRFLIGNRRGLTARETDGAGLALACAIPAFLGMLVLAVSAWVAESPSVLLLTASLAILLGLILIVDKVTRWHVLAPLSVMASALVVLVWSTRHFVPENWSHQVLFAGAIHLLYLLFPLLLKSDLKKSIEPHLAAVLSSAVFFLFARHSLSAGGFESIIGILPVAQAGLMGLLLWKLLKLEPPEERALGRLAMVAGAVLAFVTVAIPLQLEKEWITIGWALLAAALAWLGLRIPHRGLLVWTAGLLVAVFVRLVLNRAVLTYHPRSSIPVLNWYLYTYLVSAAAFFLTARLLRGRDKLKEGIPGISALASAGGVVLLFLLLNIEIADYYSVGPSLTFNFGASLPQDLTYTIGWGLFAFALLIAGIAWSNKPGRLASILLLSGTVVKCFLYDLLRLGGLYRVGSFVGLAVCLTLVAVLLQKFVLQSTNPRPKE
jgi:hypothetical protein